MHARRIGRKRLVVEIASDDDEVRRRERSEAAVLDKVAAFTSDKLLVPYIKRIYQALMDESKAYEDDEMKRNQKLI